MFKKIFIVSLLLFFTSCTAPGTALLGPAVTGATTKSVARASLSFGSNQIVKKIHETSKNTQKQVKKIVKQVENYPNNIKFKNLINFHN